MIADFLRKINNYKTDIKANVILIVIWVVVFYMSFYPNPKIKILFFPAMLCVFIGTHKYVTFIEHKSKKIKFIILLINAIITIVFLYFMHKFFEFTAGFFTTLKTTLFVIGMLLMYAMAFLYQIVYSVGYGIYWFVFHVLKIFI
jgi:hypothetical protein